MARRIRRSATNPAVSQRSGKNWPSQSTIVREPESGLWVHPSELDKPSFGRKTGDPLVDNILLDPALPPRFTYAPGRGQRVNPYGFAGFDLHLNLEPRLPYELDMMLMHPERTFFLYPSAQDNDTNPLDFTALEGEMPRQTIAANASETSFTMGPAEFNAMKFLYFFVHVSRGAWAETEEFNIDMPSGVRFPQRGIWKRTNPNATLFEQTYTVWKTERELLPVPLLGEDQSVTFYFGV